MVRERKIIVRLLQNELWQSTLQPIALRTACDRCWFRRKSYNEALNNRQHRYSLVVCHSVTAVNTEECTTRVGPCPVTHTYNWTVWASMQEINTMISDSDTTLKAGWPTEMYFLNDQHSTLMTQKNWFVLDEWLGHWHFSKIPVSKASLPMYIQLTEVGTVAPTPISGCK